MFPVSADYNFWLARQIPGWASKLAKPASVGVDELVNIHANSRTPNHINNVFALMKLWRENRKREGVAHDNLAFCKYIIQTSPSAGSNDLRRKWAKRIIRKLGANWEKHYELEHSKKAA